MMLAARGAIRASGAGLPYDAEVEYLESSGTQYINTGVKVYDNTNVEITVKVNTQNEVAFIGSATSTDRFVIRSNSGSLSYGFGNWWTNTAATLYNQWCTLRTDVSVPTVYCDGTSYPTTNTPIAKSGTDSILIFDSFRANRGDVAVASVKIWRGSTLVFDAIPVRKKTVGYLYDRVSGKLFGNEGTGDFVVGPDVVPVEWLEGTGTQYIDTGIGYYADFEIKVKMRTSLSNITLYSGGYNRLERISAALPYWRFRSNQGGSYDSTISITELHTLAWRNGKIYSDGAEVYQVSKPYQNNEMYAFGDSVSAFPCVIYYLDLWDSNDTPVRKFRPVRVGTEGAMMDVLTRRIYRNAGTGAFTYGNDLKYPIPA